MHTDDKHEQSRKELVSESVALGGEAPIVDPAPVQESLPGTETTPVEGEQPIPAPEAPNYDYLEVEDPSSKYVKVKVDGEELDVPLSEALDGYQRQADYTRSKQALAEERKQAEEAQQVYQAMQANPGLTMQVLASRAGVSVEEYLGMTPAQQQAAAEPEVPEFTDPLEREVWETRQQLQAMQQQFQDQQADQHLRGVVNGLKGQYGINDDEAREVVRQTASMKLGIDAIPMVYRAMAFDKLNVQQQAATDVSAQQAAAEAQRQAAAAAAQSTVAPGQVSANGVTQAAPSHQPKSVREAIEMAFDEQEANARR